MPRARVMLAAFASRAERDRRTNFGLPVDPDVGRRTARSPNAGAPPFRAAVVLIEGQLFRPGGRSKPSRRWSSPRTIDGRYAAIRGRRNSSGKAAAIRATGRRAASAAKYPMMLG